MGQQLERPFTGAELCALVMQRHGLSLRAFARRMGISPAAAAAWVAGRSIPTDNHGLTLAALSGLDPVAVLLCLAHTRTDCPEGRAAWRQVFTEHSRAIPAG